MAIPFGTGGVRAIMGEGENQFNMRLVIKLSRAVADSLMAADEARAREKGVAIAYDTRNHSEAFARGAAAAFAEMGVPAHLFQQPTPTPVLSFAVRHLGCAGGIVLTASHNPKVYNGYKVYNADGCQLVPHEADAIRAYIDSTSDAPAVPGGGVHRVSKSVEEAFLRAVLEESCVADRAAKAKLRAIYTPLHGTGNWFVREALQRDGFAHVHVVARQEAPDGDFPTVKSPNPEDRAALALAVEEAETLGADIVIGTDPDCDRVGGAVRHRGAFRLITGNQMGALLVDFILRTRKPLPPGGTVIKTIVTNELGAEIARKAGLNMMETLTGFKYIGQKIGQFERDPARENTFVFGYEESYGYLAGTYARDKDAVSASMLICEMAAWHKAQGRTLIDALNRLYRAYGAYADALDTVTIDDLPRARAVVEALRGSGAVSFGQVTALTDYAKGVHGLPREDVLKFTLADGSWVAVRPSGTEPKLKIYYSARGRTQREARAGLASLRKSMRQAITGCNSCQRL